MTTYFDKLYEPIKEMNKKLVEASQIAQQQPGLELAGEMLDQLRVAAIGADFLIMRPTKAYFYDMMVERKDKILQVIQLVVPEVLEIKIIKIE